VLFWCVILLLFLKRLVGISCFTIMKLKGHSFSTTTQHFQGSDNLKTYSSKGVLTTQIVVFNVSLLVVRGYHVTEG
jgi:hypothetical protein